ncbi:MAG: hypothetical protein QE269_06405 [Fimbriimonas sp.]|nr:hypothetical protein [Fimbriimonas sp.]
MTSDQRLRRIRILLGGFIFGVVISGVTAFPLTWEVNLLVQWFGQGDGGLATWLRTVQAGLQNNDQNYPFIAYGTDWLAFGHLAIAGAFVGPYRDPVKNKFIIQWGMWTCALVPLLAFTCGPIRGIPFGWRIIDSLFGIIGIVPLWLVLKDTTELDNKKIAPIQSESGRVLKDQ